MSDIHWDNPDADLGLLREHLEEAKRKKAFIISVGDHFCIMQGKYDRRSSKSKVRPEHQTNNYLDAVVDTACEWWEPYAENLAIVGYGNHETSVLDKTETDVIARFCDGLKHPRPGGRVDFRGKPVRGVYRGGYGGWFRVRAWQAKTGNAASHVTFYHHGFGGGGPVTQGKIDFNRYMAYISGVDQIIAGHVHYKECFPTTQAYLTSRNRVRQRTLHCVRLGGYKDEFKNGAGGYHIEKGRGPRPLGAYWIRFSWYARKQNDGARLKVQHMEAC